MSSIEAYILTASGRERIQRENNPLLSYEGALILDALNKGQKTIGELIDVCSHTIGSAVKREINTLVDLGLIERRDKF